MIRCIGSFLLFAVFSLRFVALWALFLFASEVHADKKTPLEIAIYADGGLHRGRLQELLADFELANNDIAVTLIPVRGVDDYNVKVEAWLERGVGPDLIYWYSGQRLEAFARKAQVLSLDGFWQKHKLDDVFPIALSSAVDIHGHKLGIPVTYYFWAMYYHQPSFQRLQLTPPKTWQDVLLACKVARAQGVDLFAFGSQTQWSTLAWFDYLNLRINGLEFYQQLLAGEIRFTDARVKRVLAHWQELLVNDCFNPNHAAYTMWQAFPRIYHGLSAMSLIDGIPQGTASDMREGLKLTAFPIIDEALPSYTVVPVNAFFVPAYTSLSPELERLLVFVAGAQFQQGCNESIYRPPANRHAEVINDVTTRQSVAEILRSPGGIQYLDRDTEFEFAKQVPAILATFMQHHDAEKTSVQLEALRQAVFGAFPVSDAP